MSGGSLPRTGMGALTIGGVAGVGAVAVPAPVGMVIVAVSLVVVGALFVRLGWRRRRPAGSR